MTDNEDDSSRQQHTTDRLVGAYERMLERARAGIERAEKDLPNLQARLAEARERAVELGELTREEADRISDYVRRDLRDAADYMTESGRELRDWMRFDMEQIGERLRGVFSDMVDSTRLELDRLAERAREASLRHTGEITAPGVLRCTNCGKEMHFKSTGHVPPCPQCRGTAFERKAR